MAITTPFVIVTDTDRTDMGEFSPVSFDLAFGDDENTFTLTAYADQFTTGKGGLVYIDGTDLGGIIDDVSVSLAASADRIMTYKGRTWAGILENLVVQPDSGQDYYAVSGEANAVLGAIVTHLGAGDIFSASAADSGLTVSFTFPRYCDAYTGLRKMADSCGGILHHAYDHIARRVVLSMAPRPERPEISNEEATITLASRRPYNHVIVGGIGELKDRVIVHRYADGAGNISAAQTFTGSEERAYFYDLNTAEQADAEEAAEQWLAEAQGSDTTTVEVTGEGLEFDVGDHVTVSDPETGTAAEVEIGKKIVRIDPYDGYTARYVTANETGARLVSGEGGSWNYRPNAPAVYYDTATGALQYGDALQTARPAIGQQLFSGTWSQGETKTVSGLSDYHLFAVLLQGAATYMLAFSAPIDSNLRAFGGYINGTPNVFAYAATFTRRGESLTLTKAGNINVAGTTITNGTVAGIYGIV